MQDNCHQKHKHLLSVIKIISFISWNYKAFILCPQDMQKRKWTKISLISTDISANKFWQITLILHPDEVICKAIYKFNYTKYCASLSKKSSVLLDFRL